MVVIPEPTSLDRILFFSRASLYTIGWFLNACNNKRVVFISEIASIDNDEILLNHKLAGRSLSHKRCFVLFPKNQTWQLRFFVDKGKYWNSKKCQNRLIPPNIDLIQKIKTIKDFEQHKEKLKDIYKKVSYGMNGSSMSMASYPVCAKKCSMKKSYATWLNGDARLKVKREMSLIENHFTCLDGMNIDFQIPHHGSHYNLYRLPKNAGKIRTYIWAGFDNRYGHPSGTVLNMVQANNVQCNQITEKNSMPIVLHETWF